MIKKIKQWLYTRFLEVWVKETLLAENQTLQAKVKALQEEIKQKDAYIAGIETGIRAQRRIVINTGEVNR